MPKKSEEPKKILIIEDDKHISTALKIKLDFVGDFNILMAENGEMGLDLAFSEHPDLILLDLVMPGMDGMTTLKNLRKDKWGKTAKIVILSNLANTGKEHEALKYDVTDYFIKTNWRITDIANMIQEKLGIKPKPESK